MKLPPDYNLNSLPALRLFVEAQSFHGDTELEMTKEQYIAYKRLVWEADFIKRFEGMEIVIPSHND